MYLGMQPLVTVTANPRSTSLSLNTMLVRGLALGNGYGTVHVPTGLHLWIEAWALTGAQPSLVTGTVLVTVQQTSLVTLILIPWCAPIEAIGVPAKGPNSGSST